MKPVVSPVLVVRAALVGRLASGATADPLRIDLTPAPVTARFLRLRALSGHAGGL
jgi:hypothetical protein